MQGSFEEKFIRTKQRAEELYKTLGELHCPYFEEKVVFNTKGLEHLKFKKKNHARSREDQYIRLKHLHLAPEIIKLSKIVQGISHTKSFEIIRSNARTEIILKPVSYYEFIAIIEGVRVRIIIKQIENGPKYFWSIIPFWKMNKKTLIRVMYHGNPELD